MEESTLALEKEEIAATPGSAAKLIREVKRHTRKKFFAEDKIRIFWKAFVRKSLYQNFAAEKTFPLPSIIPGLKISWKQARADLKAIPCVMPPRKR